MQLRLPVNAFRVSPQLPGVDCSPKLAIFLMVHFCSVRSQSLVAWELRDGFSFECVCACVCVCVCVCMCGLVNVHGGSCVLGTCDSLCRNQTIGHRGCSGNGRVHVQVTGLGFGLVSTYRYTASNPSLRPFCYSPLCCRRGCWVNMCRPHRS